MTRRALLVFVSIAALGLLAWRSLAIVDAAEYALVTEFGRPVTVLGDDPSEAGPHWIAPWRSVLRVDRRLQVAEPSPRELMTADKKDVEVWPFFAWRVADPVRFLQAAGSLAAAEARLDERLGAALAASIAAAPFDALAAVGDDPDTDPLTPRLEAVRAEVAASAAAELGVEVIDLGLRRVSYPLEVRPAIFELIRSERRQVAEGLRAAGEAEYQSRVSRAERDRRVALAEADAEARRIEADAEAQALAVLNAAHSEAPDLYAFLRTLETYRSLLDGQATLVLSTSSPLFRLLREGTDAPSPLDSETARAGLELPASRASP
jgi:membrane protease subunit HflC